MHRFVRIVSFCVFILAFAGVAGCANPPAEAPIEHQFVAAEASFDIVATEADGDWTIQYRYFDGPIARLIIVSGEEGASSEAEENESLGPVIDAMAPALRDQLLAPAEDADWALCATRECAQAASIHECVEQVRESKCRIR